MRTSSWLFPRYFSLKSLPIRCVLTIAVSSPPSPPRKSTTNTLRKPPEVRYETSWRSDPTNARPCTSLQVDGGPRSWYAAAVTHSAPSSDGAGTGGFGGDLALAAAGPPLLLRLLLGTVAPSSSSSPPGGGGREPAASGPGSRRPGPQATAVPRPDRQTTAGGSRAPEAGVSSRRTGASSSSAPASTGGMPSPWSRGASSQ
mmetsp:Transcript_34648/g.78065  ORF Transcript_34648/g.78065 Transcript_34648/m.78065 type:complete len:201 (+) Transcript_34648:677-1279(+)